MTRDDYKPFVEIVMGFAALKGRELPVAAIELYWRAMQHWSLADFRAAAEHLLLKCEFMPTPKDFEDLRQAGKPTAGEAWARVLEHCKGAYRDGRGLDDGGPIDRAVGQLGGYKAIAFHDSDFLWALEKRFAERYEEVVDVTAARVALPEAETRPLLAGGERARS